MELVKCNRCGIELERFNVHLWFNTNNKTDHPVCYECCREWYDNGYNDIYYTLYNNGSFDLADKFIFDFIGKLG